MAEYTPNINLYKKDPVRDANDTFNIQTMLNENWDKIDSALGDTTTPAKKLGLTGDLSVGASLGVLATAGDLYVWRKTKTVGEEVPASYKKEPVSGSSFPLNGLYNAITYEYGTISVSDDGVVNLLRDGTAYVSSSGNELTKVKGKFFRAVSVDQDTFAYFQKDIIYFMPTDCEFTYNSYSGRNIWSVNKTEKVTGIPAVHPGTYIDYPVSVNPNAYQESSDAQPAGYVVNDVIVKNMRLGDYENGYGLDWRYSDGVIVGNDGTLSLSEPTNQIVSSGNLEAFEAIKGKFAFVRDRGSDFNPEEIYFFPSDANIITITTPNAYQTAGITKYQTVTGYPAIPAGTTIEYLGKLGDKSRMQIVSYVGTGTYGENNPCSITADFPIESAEFLGYIDNSGVWRTGSASANTIVSSLLSTSFKTGNGFANSTQYMSSTFSKKSEDGKTVSWFIANNAQTQLNVSGYTFYFLCRG